LAEVARTWSHAAEAGAEGQQRQKKSAGYANATGPAEVETEVEEVVADLRAYRAMRKMRRWAVDLKTQDVKR
jgi:hypothetical protein